MQVTGADGLATAALALVIGIFLVVFGGIILTITLLAGEALLLLLLLVPLFFAARLFWVLPSVFEAISGDVVLRLEKVRGWRESQERIREVAAAFTRGDTPSKPWHASPPGTPAARRPQVGRHRG